MRGKLRTLSLLYIGFCVIQLTTDGKYPRNAQCSWLIQVTSGTIELQFPDFNLPSEFVFGNAACATTKVEVYDGPTVSSPLLGTYCTNTPPPAVTSNSGISMLVSFTGGTLVARGQGFQATFTIIGGNSGTTAPPLPDSTTAVRTTTSPLITTIPPTTSTSSTAAATTTGKTSSEEPTTSIPETTIATTPAFTTTELTTTTPEPTTDPSFYNDRNYSTSVYTTTQPTDPPSTTLQQDTTTPPPTISSPQDTTALPTTTTHRTASSPQDTTSETPPLPSQTPTQRTSAPSTTVQEDTTTPPPTNSSPQDTTAQATTSTQKTTSSRQDTTNEMRSTPSQTGFAVTTSKTAPDKFETGQPFNVSTIAISTVNSVIETMRPITKSTRHPDNKPVTTGTPGDNDEQGGDGGLTEDQMIMYAAIGALWLDCSLSEWSLSSTSAKDKDMAGFGHAISNPIYDRSDLDANGRYNPAYLEASRPDSAYQSLQGSLQGSREPSVDSQQDMEMDVK
ncbi:hypothetical protein Bbelb_128360 [Branchiostoma belcheri]|nr:hypothetical protein Bbelb_128360 [Branchiostoma belcheri]